MLDQRIDDGLRVLAIEFYQHHVPRLALDQRRDLAIAIAEDKVAFPVTRYRSVVDAGGSLADGYCVNDLAMNRRLLRVAPRTTHTASASQVRQQLLLQGASCLNEKTAVDGLV